MVEDDRFGSDTDLDELEEDAEDKNNKRILGVVFGVILLSAAIGATAVYVAGGVKPLLETVAGVGKSNSTGENADGDADDFTDAPVFYDVPEMLVNLSTTGRQRVYLKIRVALELEEQSDVPVIENRLPRVIDYFQIYLRELRLEDLDGSAGMYRLQEELLARVNAAVAPVQVNGVLFKEMLIQ